jgi:hypothetical protein
MESAIDKLFLDMDLNGHHDDMKQIAEILHNRSVFDFSIKIVRLFSRNMLWTSRKWHLSEMLSLIEESFREHEVSKGWSILGRVKLSTGPVVTLAIPW